MSTTPIKGGFLGKVGSLFRRSALPQTNGDQSSTAETKTQLIRPIVPRTERFTTVQLSISHKDHERPLTNIFCRHFDVSRALVYRLLREGKIKLTRARLIEKPSTEDADTPSSSSLSSSSPPLAQPGATKTFIPRENMRVQAGDLVTMTEMCLPARVEIKKPQSPELTPEAIEYVRSLVLHKDDRIIVINKPAGLAVHGGPKTERHLEAWLDGLRFEETDITPLIVHRLDRDTSGLLILARTRPVAAQLAAQMQPASIAQGRRIDKVYWAMVLGRPRCDIRQGELVANLYRVWKDDTGERMTTFADRRKDLMDQGKPAITKYRVLQLHERKDATTNGRRHRFSLLELIPLTGRTHQLRVQLAEQLKHPILGDYKYGPNQVAGKRMHLHCYRVTLRDWNGPGMHLTLKAPIPKHFIQTMNEYPLRLKK